MDIGKNQQFEKLWSYFLENVKDPEHYMRGQIKEACRDFHKIATDYRGDWK